LSQQISRHSVVTRLMVIMNWKSNHDRRGNPPRRLAPAQILVNLLQAVRHLDIGDHAYRSVVASQKKSVILILSPGGTDVYGRPLVW
jgi:hypothetical protein